ncbi:MAG: amidohydrolase family protein [Pseudomonadales bacterium]|nr:amidohydrolase family protein [Pseudomonadales bacterium]
MNYDIKITGGTIIDGDKTPRYKGDVGIKDGKIVALGSAPGDAEKVIDATGKIVSPGFVDCHTHYDAQIIWDKMMTISPWHGVTTVVIGNCGFGIAPVRPTHRDTIVRTLENVEGMDANALREGLGEDWPFESFPEYLDAIEKGGMGINVGVLMGHTPIRLYVMGDDSTERTATPEEVKQMREIVREGLRAGAMGFASSKAATHIGAGGKPVPSRLAEYKTEILEIAKVLGEEKTGIIQSTIGGDVLQDQFAEMSIAADCNVTWTALLQGMGDHNVHLKKAAELVASGAKVFPQVSPRALNFEMNFKAPFIFESMKVFKPISAADLEGKREIYGQPEFRDNFKMALKRGMERGMLAGWPKTVISDCPSDPSLNERLVFEVAAERGEEPVDLVLNLALESNLEMRVRMPVANHDEEVVEVLLKDPNVVVGLSDGGAHASQLCDACFSTHMLGHWVRERGSFDLEYAIYLLTSRSADVFNITDRGRLKVGLAADVVVFDADTVGAGELERVYDLPAGADRLISKASGIEVVIVNGQVLRENDVDQVDPATDVLPGKLLRNGAAA